MIPHECGALDVDGIVVGELCPVDVGAVVFNVGTVVDVVVRIHETDTSDPVPSRLCPVGIGLVLGVSRKSSTQVEETTIGDTCSFVSQRSSSFD